MNFVKELLLSFNNMSLSHSVQCCLIHLLHDNLLNSISFSVTFKTSLRNCFFNKKINVPYKLPIKQNNPFRRFAKGAINKMRKTFAVIPLFAEVPAIHRSENSFNFFFVVLQEVFENEEAPFSHSNRSPLFNPGY